MKEESCYVCGDPSIGLEHVPPESYFPKGPKGELIKVPSCKRHNYDLHHDQEYVRAIVATEQSTNSVARKLSEEKVVRSVVRSQRMFNEVMSAAEPTLGLDGQPTAKLTADLNRFKRVMRMMAYGVHFHIHARRHLGDFEIYSPNLTATGTATPRDIEYMETVAKLSSKGHFEHVPLANEEIFELGKNGKNGFEVSYRFEFYGGFTVLAVAVPPWRKPQHKEG